MLTLIDKLAAAWLDWRTGRMIDADPALQRLELRRVEIDTNGWTMTGISPTIAILAEEASAMLNAAEAENYLQFDMLPRADRNMRAVRITVAWANGKSPAQLVIEMQAEIERMRQLNEVLGAALERQLDK